MRRFKYQFMLVISVLSLLILATQADATNYGIFVDGSYSPGDSDSAQDRLIDRRLAKADQIMSMRDPDSQRHLITTKEALKQALETIQCNRDDTITIFLMGHGKNDLFKFTKERRSTRKNLSADELANWLESAAHECDCEIYVVLFSCHSGSFLDNLFEKEHIDSVYCSSTGKEKSYSDGSFLEDDTLVDGGDWMESFLDDWAEAPRNTNHGVSLQEAYQSAEEHMPEAFFGEQTPVGWRRGSYRALAHVEKINRKKRKLSIQYYEPNFMRSKTKWINTRNVDFPEDIEECNWISFTGNFTTPDEAPTAGTEIILANPPRVRITSHVYDTGHDREGRYLMVRPIKPLWLFSKKLKLRFDEISQLPEGLSPCNWIEQEVTVTDPGKEIHTTETINRITPRFRSKVNYEGGTINHIKGIFTAHVLQPPWLKCKEFPIQLPLTEREELRYLERDRNYLVDLELDPDGMVRGQGLRRIRKEQVIWKPGLEKPEPRQSPISAKISVGPGFMNGGGDLETLRTGEQEIVNQFGTKPGYTSHFDWDKTRGNSNLEVGAEINIKQPSSPAISIGLSTGLIKASARGIEYSVDYTDENDVEWGSLAEEQNWNFSRDYRFQAIPINVDLYLSWPQQITLFGMEVTPFGYAGVGYYFGKMTHSLTQKYLFNQKMTSDEYYDQEVDYSRESLIKEEAKSNALGLRGGLGFEINLSPFISLGAEVFGRYINFKNWTGDRSESWKTQERWYDESEGGWYFDKSDSWSENEHDNLWVYEGVNEIINKKYIDLRIHEKSPDSSLYSNIEKAALNLNSFGIKLSIRYRFSFKKGP